MTRDVALIHVSTPSMTSKERKAQQNAASKRYFEKYVVPLTVSAHDLISTILKK
jgi:hypothetical protein